MPKLIPLLLAGVAGLSLLGGRRKKRRSESISFEGDTVIVDPLSNVGFNEVGFTSDLSKFKIGLGYKTNILNAWLDDRREEGKLATIDHDSGWLYDTFVDDPTTWIGDITGLGKSGGKIIYSALWLMATAGIGIYATGFASAGVNIHAATQAASLTRAMQILGPRSTAIAGQLYNKGLSSTKIAVFLMDFGGAQSLTKYGVSQAMSGISAGAAGFGASMSASVLAEAGIDKLFTPDLATSATEAAAEFTINHNVTIAGERVPIALLPGSYPAVQEFNKWLMSYIIKFQKMRFED